MRLRYLLSCRNGGDKDDNITRDRWNRANGFHHVKGMDNVYVSCVDTFESEYRGHPPQLQLIGARRGNSNEVWSYKSLTGFGLTSKPTAREAELFSGEGKAQEANASRRKARGIHNSLDRTANMEKCKSGDTQPERVLTWTW